MFIQNFHNMTPRATNKTCDSYELESNCTEVSVLQGDSPNLRPRYLREGQTLHNASGNRLFHKSKGLFWRVVQEVGCGGMEWIDLVQDRDWWRELVKAVMNIRLPSNKMWVPDNKF